MEYLPEYNTIDLVAGVFILLSMLHGYRRGLSGEVAQLIGVIVGFCLGIAGYRPFAAWMTEHTRMTGRAADALAFIAILLVSSIALVIVRFFLSRVMRVVFDESVNKAGGLLAALLRSSVVTLIVFMAMNLVPHDYLNRQFGEASLIGRGTLRLLPVLKAEIEKRADEEPADDDPSGPPPPAEPDAPVTPDAADTEGG